MKSIFFSLIILFAVLIACAPKAAQKIEAQAQSAEKAVLTTQSLTGNWRLIHYVFQNDTIAPIDGEGDDVCLLSLNDSSLSIHTGCNTLSGGYSLDNDTLFPAAITRTMMLCHDMTVENAMAALFADKMEAMVDADSLFLSSPGGDKAIFIRH